MIEDRPLAVCDYRSMVPSDLIVADRIFPHDDFELYFVKHNANQSWHWLSKQTPEEVTLILMYDTSAEHARCESKSLAVPDNPLVDFMLIHHSLRSWLFRKSVGIRVCASTRKRRNEIGCHKQGGRYIRVSKVCRSSVTTVGYCCYARIFRNTATLGCCWDFSLVPFMLA